MHPRVMVIMNWLKRQPIGIKIAILSASIATLGVSISFLQLLRASETEQANGQSITGGGNQIIQIQGDIHAPVTFNNDPLAKEALATLQKQLDKANLSLEEKDQLIKSQQETIHNFINAKQSQSLPKKSVNDAFEEIIKTGDTKKAEALLTRQIDANTKKVKEYQEAIKAQAELYSQRGTLAFLTDTHAALADFTEATKLDPDNASAWNQKGHLHQRLGQLDEALNAYAQIKQLGKSQEDKALIAVAIGNMGMIYIIRGELDKALELYQQALEINKALGSKEGMASDYTNMGVVYKTRGGLDKALEMYQQALEINKALGLKEGMANQYGNMGVVYQTRGDLDKALELYQQALEIHKALGHKEGMANQYGNIGLVYKARGELDKARKLWQQSLQLFTEIGAKPKIERVQGWLDGLNQQGES